MSLSIRVVSILLLSSLVRLVSAQVVATIPGFAATYPVGKIGGSSATGIPMNYVNIPPANEYYLDYEVAFDSGWAWVKGGKLPGLVGGSHTSGCAAIVPGGWSARFMWRTGGQGEVYLYDQDRKNGCGDDYVFPGPGPGTYALGKWNRITERVVINTPGQKNGLIEAWLDGVKKVSLNNIQLRGNVAVDSALVNQVSLETFYGGSSHTWAPPLSTHSRFNGFVVRKDLPDFTKPFQPVTVPTSVLENPRQDGHQALGGSGERRSLFDLRGRSLGTVDWNPDRTFHRP